MIKHGHKMGCWMINLKDAQKEGKLDEFIKEHKKDEPADQDKFDTTLSSVSQGKKKSVPETSVQDSSEN